MLTSGRCRSTTPAPSAARRFFREALAGSDLPGDLIHDGVTMASELAANTMNAHGNIEFGGQGRPESGMPEIWLYLRAFGSGREACLQDLRLRAWLGRW